ncbi:MAG TPA: hypothetical protein VHI93_06575 [Candidatus Thermoplasmatota archaeon]|nr:hypothetical protein [Candidatus Thermoplasmatota archaeon]
MRPLPFLAAATLALCAAQPAAAAGPASLEAVVEGLWMHGALGLDGTLAALSSTGHPGPASAVPPLASDGASRDARAAPASLRLAAQRMHVETDIERQDGSPTLGTTARDRESADFRTVSARTAPARERFQFYLVPLPGHAAPTVQLKAAQVHLQPGEAPPEPERFVASADRPPLQGAPGPALSASGGLRTLRVEGTFLLTLWEWDLEVPGGVLRSGYSYTPALPSAGVDTVGRSEERQVFVQAEGAVLEMDLPNGAAVALALHPRGASLDGRLVLDRPQGRLQTLSGAQALRDGDWVDGNFTAALTGLTPSSFHAMLKGTGRQAHLADLTVAIAGPPPSATGAALATFAASAIAIAGGWRLWGRRARRNLPVPLRLQPLPEGDDELQALHWLSHASHAGVVLWDSDLMFAFDWSVERAQDALRALLGKGQVRCKAVALAPGRFSLGQVALTAAGADRLRAAARRRNAVPA